MKIILLALTLSLALTANANDEFIKESNEAKQIAKKLNESATKINTEKKDKFNLDKKHHKLLQHLSVYKKQKHQKLKKQGHKNIQHQYHFSQQDKNNVKAKLITTSKNKTGQNQTTEDQFDYNTKTQTTKITKKNQKPKNINNTNLISHQELSNTLKKMNNQSNLKAQQAKIKTENTTQ